MAQGGVHHGTITPARSLQQPDGSREASRLLRLGWPPPALWLSCFAGAWRSQGSPSTFDAPVEGSMQAELWAQRSGRGCRHCSWAVGARHSIPASYTPHSSSQSTNCPPCPGERRWVGSRAVARGLLASWGGLGRVWGGSPRAAGVVWPSKTGSGGRRLGCAQAARRWPAFRPAVEWQGSCSPAAATACNLLRMCVSANANIYK